MIRRCVLVLLFLLFSSIAFGEAEKAPELRKAGVWINSPELSLKSLRGKVVLLDFWAFDCEPCIQAMPHIRALYDRYESRGLVVIGVHAARTKDERNIAKLREAVKRLDIRFPVVSDNDQKIWGDYRCDLWPTAFVIDRNGAIRYSRGGDGRYDDLEKAIQSLLDSQ